MTSTDLNLNEPPDLRTAFGDHTNRFSLPMRVQRGEGDSLIVTWQAAQLTQRMAFNVTTTRLAESNLWEFPNAYGGTCPERELTITPLGARAIRIQMEVRAQRGERPDPGILPHVPSEASDAWTATHSETSSTWSGPHGSLTVTYDPWAIELRDASGVCIWSTWTHAQAASDSLYDRHTEPTMAICREYDRRWMSCLAWTLQPDEVLVGGGEHFGPLNKRNQVLHWFTTDAHSSQATTMYKPVPVLLSNQGYGLLFHTTAAITADLGQSYHGAASALLDDDVIDVVAFLGEPSEILDQYTSLSGRSPVPPLWSFGLWMSRITYDNEAQVREVASKLREEAIPCDVIHLDTGWFEHDWRCDYTFSTSRFTDATAMLNDLHTDGFTVSLWQLPYFTPANQLFDQVRNGLAITDGDGGLPTGDAILDYSHPDAVAWYQDKLAPLLRAGVGAIKVDFGEGAPAYGTYHSGQSGRYEHNRYPMRYQEAAFDVTVRERGESIVWARAAWAGCQRYPLHWGGDAETTDQGFASSLRGGLSLGLTGFSFWSHDAGGFTKRPDPDLYLRWLAAGVLGSHVRTHGQPPREPWTYDDPAFTATFRALVELRYQLIPYLWQEAKTCADHGQPLMRAMLLDNAELPEAWHIDHQYRLGHDLLVAPLLRAGQRSVRVWLPPGGWTNWFTQEVYHQGGWVTIEAGDLPVILLARCDSSIPLAPVAQHTGAIDWDAVTARQF